MIDTPHTLPTLTKTRSALARAHRYSVRSLAAADGFRLAARIGTAILVAMALDLLFPLDGPFRAMIVAGLAAWTVISGREIGGRLAVERIGLERAARLLEERHPGLDNAFINAVQFGNAFAERPDGPTTSLMRREIDRAEQAADSVPTEAATAGIAIAHARKGLLIVLGVAAATMALYPRAWRFEAPRFLFFWADYPPFSLTDFELTPGSVHVKTGGSLEIHLSTHGLAPESVNLVSVSARSRQSIPFNVADGGGYTQTLEGLTDDTDYFVQANTGRSARYHIVIDRAPVVRGLRVTLHPPAYTKQPSSTIAVGQEGISGLNGTRVDLDLESSRPLASATMTIEYPDMPAEQVALTIQPGRGDHVMGGFTIRRSGTFRIALAGADGQQARDAAHGKINLLRDEKPLVSLTVPGRNAVVTPEMQVPIRATAEDDVGIDRIELHRIVNNMADSAMALPTQPGHKSAEAGAVLDLKDLGARPGDVIQYYATAYDNDPGTHNLTDSDRYWIWVVSNEDYKKILAKQRGLPEMAAQYRKLTDSLKSLADAQRDLADRMRVAAKKSNSRIESLKQEQEALRKSAQGLARQMRMLAAEKPQYDIEQGLKKKLVEIAKQIEAAAGNMQTAAAASNSAGMARNGDLAARQLAKAGGQSQQSIEKALQTLEKIAPLYADVQKLKLLAAAEGALAMQAREQARKPKTDPYQQSRLRELSERQAEIREKLAETQRDLSSHADEAQVAAPAAAQQARRLAQAVEKTAVADRMQGAESALRSRDAVNGAGEAEEAQRILESLFRQGSSTKSAGKQALDNQISLGLGEDAGDTLEQLAGRMSLGMGQGRGIAQGQGGNPAPRPGSRPGDGDEQGGGQSAVALSLQQETGSTNRKKDSKPHLAAGERPAALGSQDVERLTDPSRKPPAAADSASGRYPAEYRRLVKDYFKAVAGGR